MFLKLNSFMFLKLNSKWVSHRIAAVQLEWTSSFPRTQSSHGCFGGRRESFDLKQNETM